MDMNEEIRTEEVNTEEINAEAINSDAEETAPDEIIPEEPGTEKEHEKGSSGKKRHRRTTLSAVRKSRRTYCLRLTGSIFYQ